MASQDQRRADTRARLVAAARARFVADGYDAASLARVLADAGVSKGALYHHFPSKDALFAAVFDEISREVIAAAGKAARRARAPRLRLIETCFQWLKAAAAPAAGVILFEEAPKALGWTRAKAIEEENSISLMRAGVEAAIGAGEARCANVELAVRLINAALGELAMLRHASGGRTPTDREARAAIAAIIEGLLPAPAT